MKLYIPKLGDQLRLSKDWTFDLHWEYRNEKLWGKEWDPKVWKNPPAPKKFTFDTGVTLKVDRIYIRHGAQEFDSITFRVVDGTHKGARFWAKLDDCNTLEFDQAQAAPKKLQLVWPYIRGWRNESAQGIPGLHYSKVFKTDYPVEHVVGVKNVPIMFIEHTGTYTGRVHEGMPSVVYLESHSSQYTLKTLEGEILGTWKSMETLKKKAKEYLAQHHG